MASKAKMNGSADMLANAMRQVFSEAVEGGMEPVRKDIAGVNKRLDGVDKRLDGVGEHLEALTGQVSHHQKALDGIKKPPC